MRREHRRSAGRLEVGHFFGANVRSETRCGLVLSETHYLPQLEVPRHHHERPYFCLLVAGGYWERYGRTRIDYAPGSIVYHPKQEEHWGDIGPQGGRCFHVELSPFWVERAEEHGTLPGDVQQQSSGDLSWLALRLFREFRADGLGAGLILEALALEMLHELLRRGGAEDRTAPSFVRLARERLHEEFDRPTTIAEMGADLGISAVRLARSYRRFYGESIADTRRRLRVEHVSRRLADPGADLATVAVEAGFADQSHLSRVFKRVTRTTPGQYRRLLLGNR